MRYICPIIPPITQQGDWQTFVDYFNDQAENSDEIYIASGYASRDSLKDLDDIVKNNNIGHIVLVLGMYVIEGFPEAIYNSAIRLNDDWLSHGIGEIRVTTSMKYHGKIYVFRKNGETISACLGSANLGTLHPVDRQFEMSVAFDEKDCCAKLYDHVLEMCDEPLSINIKNLSNPKIVRAESDKLDGVNGVEDVSDKDFQRTYANCTDIEFDIPLKVPGIPGDANDYMKSNINKAYAKGRLNTKTGEVQERGWWETEVVVSRATTSDPNYPDQGVPFWVITDDKKKFLMHASGTNKKNFESHTDLKILGYWLKGRLVAAGIVDPVDSPSQDLLLADPADSDKYRKCHGVITYEKLQRYGRTSLSFVKTSLKMNDDDGIPRDVWLLSFLPKS